VEAPSKQCPFCKAASPAHAAFCLQCGQAFPLGAGDTPGPSGWQCTCGTWNTVPFCRSCAVGRSQVTGTRRPSVSQPGRHADPDPSPPAGAPAGATPFKMMTPDELSIEAQARARRSDRTGALPAASCLFLAAFLSLLIPIIGPFMFLGLLGTAIWYGVRSLLGIPDADTVRAVSNQMRNNLYGTCPSCQTEILLIPAGTTFTVHCPLCGTPLKYDRGWVWADRL
jgi:hypothetical protein